MGPFLLLLVILPVLLEAKSVSILFPRDGDEFRDAKPLQAVFDVHDAGSGIVCYRASEHPQQCFELDGKPTRTVEFDLNPQRAFVTAILFDKEYNKIDETTVNFVVRGAQNTILESYFVDETAAKFVQEHHIPTFSSRSDLFTFSAQRISHSGCVQLGWTDDVQLGIPCIGVFNETTQSFVDIRMISIRPTMEAHFAPVSAFAPALSAALDTSDIEVVSFGYVSYFSPQLRESIEILACHLQRQSVLLLDFMFNVPGWAPRWMQWEQIAGSLGLQFSYIGWSGHGLALLIHSSPDIEQCRNVMSRDRNLSVPAHPSGTDAAGTIFSDGSSTGRDPGEALALMAEAETYLNKCMLQEAADSMQRAAHAGRFLSNLTSRIHIPHAEFLFNVNAIRQGLRAFENALAAVTKEGKSEPAVPIQCTHSDCLPPPAITAHKLRFDLRQLEELYLGFFVSLETGRLATGPVRKALLAVNQGDYLAATSTGQPLPAGSKAESAALLLKDGTWALLRPWYQRVVYSAHNSDEAKRVEGRSLGSTFYHPDSQVAFQVQLATPRENKGHVSAAHDVLSPVVLESVRRILQYSTIYGGVTPDSIMAEPQHGLVAPVLGQIAEELMEVFPMIMSGRSLKTIRAVRYSDTWHQKDPMFYSDMVPGGVTFAIFIDDVYRMKEGPVAGGFQIVPVLTKILRPASSRDKEIVDANTKETSVFDLEDNRVFVYEAGYYYGRERVPGRDRGTILYFIYEPFRSDCIKNALS